MMQDTIEFRISRLLNQLEKPGLPESEIAAIKDKIEFLRGLEK